MHIRCDKVHWTKYRVDRDALDSCLHTLWVARSMFTVATTSLCQKIANAPVCHTDTLADFEARGPSVNSHGHCLDVRYSSSRTKHVAAVDHNVVKMAFHALSM